MPKPGRKLETLAQFRDEVAVLILQAWEARERIPELESSLENLKGIYWSCQNRLGQRCDDPTGEDE